MTLGYSQNNPSNLINGIHYQGEIPSDNNFAAFSDITYGIRAWLMNLHYKIIIRGIITYADYFKSFLNSSVDDIDTYTANATPPGFKPDDKISLEYSDLKNLFFAQIHQEISPDDKLVSSSDYDNGYALFDQGGISFAIKKTATFLNFIGTPSYYIIAAAAIIIIFFLPKKHIK